MPRTRAVPPQAVADYDAAAIMSGGKEAEGRAGALRIRNAVAIQDREKRSKEAAARAAFGGGLIPALPHGADPAPAGARAAMLRGLLSLSPGLVGSKRTPKRRHRDSSSASSSDSDSDSGSDGGRRKRSKKASKKRRKKEKKHKKKKKKGR